VIFQETSLPGAFVIEPERREDARGFFARTWCVEEFATHGLKAKLAQCSVSFNKQAGTVRGMHYQAAPHAEAKVVRCTHGAIYDVIVELATRRHFGVELTAENRRQLYVPEGFAHGFVTLTDNTEVEYLISEFYAPAAARGFRYDDPAFGIRWPVPVRVISERDQSYAHV